MQKIPLFVYAITGALLLSLAWPAIGSLSFVIFIAWVPMLLAEDHIFRKNYRPRRVFFLAYLYFLCFNIITTWWIYYASPGGMVMAVLANSLLMTFPFWLFHVTKRRVGIKEGYIAFLLNWLGFEYLHYRWELSWPWLSMGNVFANDVKMIQWYDITGVTGGSLWILLVNLIFFFIIRDAFWLKTRPLILQKFRLVIVTLFIFIPVAISLKTYYSYEEKIRPADILLVQPNIDPYTDKFSGMSMTEQLDVFFSLADQEVDPQLDFLVGPETQLGYPIEEGRLKESNAFKPFYALLSRFPRLRIISGMSGYRLMHDGDKLSATAKPLDEPGWYFDHYNTAFQLSNTEDVELYHKMKLVLGVEKIPFSSWLPFLEKLAIKMGGASGSMGTEIAPKNFYSAVDPGMIVAPAICYESIYGDHIAAFVEKGATLLFIITNDGWWRETPGYKQHLAYARIRAIENRRSVARCANTGVSCFINQRGDIIQQTEWWKATTLRGKINANDTLTYYTRNGDFIGRTSVFVGIMLLIYTLSRWLMGKTTSNKEV